MSQLPLSDIRKVLNSHGYGYQFAVLHRARELAEEGTSRWIFQTSEFPVGHSQNTTHVDFILGLQDRRVYLVAECKRVDPAKARWCFVPAPCTRRGQHEHELVFQEIGYFPPRGSHAYPRTAYASIDACHLGVELRTAARGDGVTGRTAIKDATAQVLRGMNGLIDHLFLASGGTWEAAGTAVFVPVIFTTAELLVVRADLSQADLRSGELPPSWGDANTQPVPWLWFTPHQSPALRHQIPTTDRPQPFDLSAALHSEFARTIAVVGPAGIDPFLRFDLGSWL